MIILVTVTVLTRYPTNNYEVKVCDLRKNPIPNRYLSLDNEQNQK